MRLYGILCVFMAVLPWGIEAQVDEEMERMRQEEERYKQAMQQKEQAYADKVQSGMDSLHQQYLRYEQQREAEILEWEGKNIDPRLRNQAVELEARYPLNKSFLPIGSDSHTLLNRLEEEVELPEAAPNSEVEEEAASPVEKVPSSSPVSAMEQERTAPLPEAVNEEAPREITDLAPEEVTEPTPEEVTEAEPAELPEDAVEAETETDAGEEVFSGLPIQPSAYHEVGPQRLQEELEANRPIVIPLLPGAYRISSPFNPNRMHPVLKKRRPHKGIDLAAPTGTPVYSPADGVVEIAKFSPSAGNFVMVNHRNGYKTQYFHLDSYEVKVGDEVARGDRLGEVGSTGYSTGPHLHYEIRNDNIPLDPKPFMLGYLAE